METSVMRLLDGRRTVITGAGSGIGRATALHLAEEGSAVVIGDVNAEAGEATVRTIKEGGGSAWSVATDVSQERDIEKLMDVGAEEMGGIDILVSNAGIQRSGAAETFDAKDWTELMEVNAKSCFLGAKYALPYLRKSPAGVIVNMASLAGIRGGAGMTAYSASKGAIVAFTRALAEELGPSGIRVNCICPGWIDTDFNGPAIEAMGGPEELETFVQSRIPLGRQADPREVASVILYVASDLARYVTAQALIVDGGLH